MKKTIQFIAMLFMVAIAITSCNTSAPKLTKYIPKDAAFVAGVNAKNITEKLALANMDLDTLATLFASNSGDSAASAEQKWNELKASGIDLGAEFYVFGSSTTSIMDGKSTTMGAVAFLKDAAAFEQYLKKKLPLGETKSTADYSYMALGDDFVAGWKGNIVILANAHNGKSAPGVYSTGEGTLSQLLLTKLFAQSESESVESIDAFKNVEKEQGDIMFFSSASASGGDALSALSLTKIGDLVADSYNTGTINFEDGQITAKITGYTGKALGDILAKYPSHAIDASALGKFQAPVNGFMSFSFNPQVLVEIVKFAGAEQLVSQGLEPYNLTMDDVVKAFKGDVTAAFSMDGSVPQPVPGEQNNKFPGKFVVNAAIGDKVAYDKIVASLAAKNIQLPKSGSVDVPFMGSFSVSVTDKNLVVASSADVLQQYMAGTVAKTNIPADIAQKTTGKSFALYADIEKMQEIAATWHTSKPEGDGKKDTSAPMIKDFIATSDKIDGKIIKGSAELRLLDGKQNSLVTLVKRAFADKLAGKHFSLRHIGDIENFRILPPLSGLR